MGLFEDVEKRLRRLEKPEEAGTSVKGLAKRVRTAEQAARRREEQGLPPLPMPEPAPGSLAWKMKRRAESAACADLV